MRAGVSPAAVGVRAARVCDIPIVDEDDDARLELHVDVQRRPLELRRHLLERRFGGGVGVGRPAMLCVNPPARSAASVVWRANTSLPTSRRKPISLLARSLRSLGASSVAARRRWWNVM